VRADRRHWILATKVANPMTAKPRDGGLSRRWIMQACDDSLERLRTDYIDVYYLHKDDRDTPIAETVAAMGDLIRSGKVLYFGVSNFRGWRIAEVVSECAAQGVPKPVVCQPYYNLLNRMPEVEVLECCRHHGIGVVPYSPIARGVLTGKYAPGAKPEAGSRAGRGDKRMLQTEFREESFAVAQALRAHCERKGVQLTHFATAWVLANRAVSAVIAGPRTFDQWTHYFGALEVTLSAEDEAVVDSLVAPGHPSTPGYNDPVYPLAGR
jgi:aryl-alcohol dehydrogenase-like predicted oxidoreductase